MIASVVFVSVLCLLLVFQLALAFGAPWGQFAWGGQHRGTLPVGYRIASGLSILIYGFIGAIVLDRGGVVGVFPPGFSTVAIWFVFGFLALGVLANAISRSKAERYAATPVALILAVLALLLALGAGMSQQFSGMVLDRGDGPVFCTVMLTSLPPQCGNPTPLANWDWNATEFDEAQGSRWGEYRFLGTQTGDAITVDGPVTVDR